MSSKRPPGGPPTLKDSHRIGDVAPNQPDKNADGQDIFVPMVKRTTVPPEAKKTHVEQEIDRRSAGKSEPEKPKDPTPNNPKKDKDHDRN